MGRYAQGVLEWMEEREEVRGKEQVGKERGRKEHPVPPRGAPAPPVLVVFQVKTNMLRNQVLLPLPSHGWSLHSKGRGKVHRPDHAESPRLEEGS